VEGIDVAAASVLSAARFRGNVSQLEQVIERAVLIASGPLITPYDLPDMEADAPAPIRMDSAEWNERAASAMRVAMNAGTEGDYTAFKRAKREMTAALHGAFVDGVTGAVGTSPSRAARHCSLHRIQWQRLRGAAGGTRATETGSSSSDVHQKSLI
jgi:DNA-binding NtrC family response regulator